MGVAEEFPSVEMTATSKSPAFVEPFKPIDGPTVWYGKDLTVEVLYNHFNIPQLIATSRLFPCLVF